MPKPPPWRPPKPASRTPPSSPWRSRLSRPRLSRPRQSRPRQTPSCCSPREPNSPNPQTTPRLCLTGTATPIADPAARAIFLESHPYASLYVDFADFAFWRVFVTDAYYIGGFGAARRLDIEKLIGAS
jgi:hypothetical protein